MKRFKLINNWIGLPVRISVLMLLALVLVNYMVHVKRQAQEYTYASDIPSSYKVWCFQPSCIFPASVKEFFRIDRLWK